MELNETKAKAYQALQIMQRMKQQCDEIVEEFSSIDPDEYARVELSYEKLKGKVYYQGIPFLKLLSSQIDILAASYYEVMEVIRYEVESDNSWPKQAQTKSQDNSTQQQPDIDQGTAPKRQDTSK